MENTNGTNKEGDLLLDNKPRIVFRKMLQVDERNMRAILHPQQ